ncbi:MAG: Response regulator receiver protein [Candidatus Saccharibacteria bacterium GW2011_GWA2_46_10]|nr:MAG: Response regulator receiver protein [Candidatus Saccharibacteria bacterium GW2011_GWA2_46_10]
MKKKILVIDDDKLVLRTVKQLLERVQYEVFCASSGDEAEILVDQHKFALVISDIRMPGQDGINVIRRLRERLRPEASDGTPFMFMTGYASEDAPIDAIKLGAGDYLLKPFDLDELLNSVKKHAR